MAKGEYEEMSEVSTIFEKNGGLQVGLPLEILGLLSDWKFSSDSRILCRHCQHQFCWVCSASWDKHGYQNKTCNAFAEPMMTDPESTAKANLDRWLFYFDRWNNHELSARLDEQLYERAEERIKEVQVASGLSWIEVRFLFMSMRRCMR